MCFSATASFIAGTTLSVVGVAALKRTEAKTELPFAAIPLLFGIQQLIEGVIWLTFSYDTPFLKQTLTYVKLSGMKLGLLVNFGAVLIKDGITRLVNGLPD